MEEQRTELTLEEALEKLEETIEKLQSSETTLEDSFKIYREGMEYIRFCNDTIDKVEKKVLILNEEGDLSEFSEGTGA
ncbi:MAG: exodeoxyribonuclease VII small subunit [Lachnospiraceae bacterium]|nr:exodeoxyribonuclease VII small subunit [Lachnospiraceae bacterium]